MVLSSGAAVGNGQGSLALGHASGTAAGVFLHRVNRPAGAPGSLIDDVSPQTWSSSRETTKRIHTMNLKTTLALLILAAGAGVLFLGTPGRWLGLAQEAPDTTGAGTLHVLETELAPEAITRIEIK